MKLVRLTAVISICFLFFASFSSCEKESELKKVNVYSKIGIALTGTQVVPVVNPAPTGATGSLSISYDKRTRILNYTFSWSGLTSVPTRVGIYGPAPTGYAALTLTGLAPALQTIPVTGLKVNGTYSGSLLIENVQIKESDLLNFLYYVEISTASYPTGEIRAQINFQ